MNNLCRAFIFADIEFYDNILDYKQNTMHK